MARAKLHTSLQHNQRLYNLKTNQNTFQPGDLVYLRRKSHSPGVSKKLSPLWDGPYLVEAVVSPLVVSIRTPRRSIVVHHDLLKPCLGNSMPLWAQRARSRLLNPDPVPRQPDASTHTPNESVPSPSDAATPTKSLASPPAATDDDAVLGDLRYLFHAPSVSPNSVPAQPSHSRGGRPIRLPLRFQ